MNSSPLFKLIVPVTEKLIVSPATAFAIASRKRQFGPGQCAALAVPSPVLVTGMVLATAAGAWPVADPCGALAAILPGGGSGPFPCRPAASPCRCQKPVPINKPRARINPATLIFLFMVTLLYRF